MEGRIIMCEKFSPWFKSRLLANFFPGRLKKEELYVDLILL